MSRSRPRPVAAVAAEESAWAEACATLAPQLELLEALETMLTFTIFAVRHSQDMERLLTEHARLTAETARLTEELAGRRESVAKWDRAVEAAIDRARQAEHRGIRVEVPR